jgi:hypothetical protein
MNKPTELLLDRLISREIEDAYREGWRDGYHAGRVDGGSDFDWADPDADWQKSKARALTTDTTGD